MSTCNNNNDKDDSNRDFECVLTTVGTKHFTIAIYIGTHKKIRSIYKKNIKKTGLGVG